MRLFVLHMQVRMLFELEKHASNFFQNLKTKSKLYVYAIEKNTPIFQCFTYNQREKMHPFRFLSHIYLALLKEKFTCTNS